MRRLKRGITGLIFGASLVFVAVNSSMVLAQTQDTGSVGLEGRISGAPPSQAAIISFPRDGATITELPTTVTGICQSGLLVKIFKNNVFAGAVQCVNNSFSIQIDLFSGRNELVARVYDDLDQAGPDSNVVVVTMPFDGLNIPTRIALTSAFAKRGANPGQTLTWPIVISGGNGPYAITVNWGDGKTADIISQEFPGNFNIAHIYDSAGVYNIVIRATDRNGNIAFLQLVGVANGPVGQNTGNSQTGGDGGETVVINKILWLPVLIALPLIVISFILGKRHQLSVLRKRLERRDDIS